MTRLVWWVALIALAIFSALMAPAVHAAEAGPTPGDNLDLQLWGIVAGCVLARRRLPAEPLLALGFRAGQGHRVGGHGDPLSAEAGWIRPPADPGSAHYHWAGRLMAEGKEKPRKRIQIIPRASLAGWREKRRARGERRRQVDAEKVTNAARANKGDSARWGAPMR
jgi:hypothetical protein